MSIPSHDRGELEPYLAAGWQLIPLHKYDREDEHTGKDGRTIIKKRGKSPTDKDWTRRLYNSRDVATRLEKGLGNVGVRLRASDLVVDVDPRNFPEGETLAGNNPFKRLCEDVDLDPSLYPTVETGSGGLHLYMTKPVDISLSDTLDGYPGVEFKSLGRQVVAAGSVHPDTLLTYRWDFLLPSLRNAPEAPQALLNVARRPTGAPTSGGGEHTQEEVAAMLEALDPEEFRDHDAWLKIMQACHHASGGDARQEFIDWSTSDPQYANDAGIIGHRWDSLHADSSDRRVTYRTLHKLLRDAGEEAAIPRTPPEDDFEPIASEDKDVLPDDDAERLGPLERLNQVNWAVLHGGKFRVMREKTDPTFEPPRRYWESIGATDFKLLLANRRVQRGDKAVPLADAWLEWGGRRTAEGVVFDPERDHPGRLNLWTGWGIKPRKGGSWARLEELLREVLCDGDEAVAEYVLNWSAYMTQHPGRPAETAVCFQGAPGVGKGTWGRSLMRLAGRHGMQVASSEHLTGRFNAHLRDVILLFADEALSPYDKAGESRLKALITEPVLAFEAKGTDITSDRNHLHIIMASNEDWFVPMALQGERRFLLQRANDKWRGKAAWFNRLHDELEDGGYEALLWDLMNRPLDGWTPRGSIPSTAAAVSQKLMNLSPVAQWWFNVLDRGGFGDAEPCVGNDTLGFPWNTEWHKGQVRFFYQDVKDDFEAHCRRSGIRSPGGMGRGIDMVFAAELRKMCPDMTSRTTAKPPEDRFDLNIFPSNGRARAYEFPSLSDCRKALESMLGGSVDWGTMDDRD